VKNKWLPASILLVITAALIGVGSAFAAAGYSLDWWTVDGGGGTTSSSGGDYSLGGSIGQPDSGTSAGGTYSLEGGFWAAGVQTPGDQTLSVSKSGEGTVTSEPGGIDCGLTCEYAFANNESVTLTAEPTAGWIFTGWSDAACPGTGSCTLVMDTARSVTATFMLVTQRIYLPLVNR
jgi:hypothetical protein